MSAGQPIAPDLMVKVLKDDLAAFDASLEKGGVQDAVILANRFMSNASLFGSGPSADSLLFVGVTLRLAGEDLVQVLGRHPGKDPRLRESLDAAQDYVSAVGHALPDAEKEFAQVARSFFQFHARIVKNQQSPEEEAGYTEPADLGDHARKVLESFLIDHLETIHQSRGRVFDGIINESSRLMRVHPFNERDLCFFTSVRVMALVNSYFQYLISPIEREAVPPPTEAIQGDQRMMAAGVRAYVSKLEEGGDTNPWVTTRDFTAPWIRRWRELFLLYMDIPAPGPTIGIYAQPQASGAATAKREELARARKPK